MKTPWIKLETIENEESESIHLLMKTVTRVDYRRSE